MWHGVYVPADTPDDVVAKITDALAAALTDQAVVAKLAELGLARAGGGRDARGAPAEAAGADRPVGADHQGVRCDR